MFRQFAAPSEDERGFTLIELLVVILIIGILAAIAIPAFLNQKSKANDAQAKELVRTAQTTAMTAGTDNNGSFTSVSLANLNSVEPTLYTTAAAAGGGAYLTAAGGTSNTFSVVATSSNGNAYTISRASTGSITRSCTASSGAAAGGCVGGSW